MQAQGQLPAVTVPAFRSISIYASTELEVPFLLTTETCSPNLVLGIGGAFSATAAHGIVGSGTCASRSATENGGDSYATIHSGGASVSGGSHGYLGGGSSSSLFKPAGNTGALAGLGGLTQTLRNSVNKKWSTARTDQPMASGVYKWEVHVDRCISKNIFIGVAAAEARLDNYVGCDRYTSYYIIVFYTVILFPIDSPTALLELSTLSQCV
jgi:hypothetical protein